MKSLLIILTILASCSGNKNVGINQDSIHKQAPVALQPETSNDTLFIFDDFLFEGHKDTKFEIVKKGEQPKAKTKGDTLYIDNELMILGDQHAVTSFGIYKKHVFKSVFKDFQTKEIYKGKLANPDFRTDPNAKYFITRIKEGCENNGVNFAGHYTIIEWGCGAGCQQMAVVDRMNGKIIFSKIPFDTLDGHCGLNYKIDSRMIVVNTEAISDYEGYARDYWRKPEVYEIKDGKILLVEK